MIDKRHFDPKKIGFYIYISYYRVIKMESQKSSGTTVQRIFKKITYDNATIAIGLFLLTAGLAYYFAWADYFDAWTDPGLYSLVVVFIAFGFMAIVLGETKKRLPKPKE
ncbi:MAG: hypothetical protein ACYCR7_03435 [Thermoplasmataceae archaeon]